jgi:hypothetical protein
MHLEDVHCQQIVLGGSTDQGYARLLGPYAENEALRQRITLIEGPPFARELQEIKNRFRTVSFNRVFRSQKLPDVKRRVLPSPSSPLANYAATLAKPNTSTSTPLSADSNGFKSPAANKVLRNRNGERVDPQSKFLPQELVVLKQRKLCNAFHLLGKCQFLDDYGYCNHIHAVHLDQRQLEILRVVARQSPCSQGVLCNDPTCTYGHQCTRKGCDGSNCRFPYDMHNIGTEVVG